MDAPFPVPARIEGPSVWYGSQMASSENWIYRLTRFDVAEIDAALKSFKQHDFQIADINATTFPLESLANQLHSILHDLLHGHGFFLIRGLPIDRYSEQEAAIIYLGIGAHLGSFRSQNAKGHLLGHVRDLGADIRNGGTRYYQTNKQLEYHTDSCDIVGLLCLKAARSGGESRILSSVALYNEMRARYPELAEALFHAYPTDRRGEVPVGMDPWFDMPVFNWYAGELTTIYVGQYIRSAQQNFPRARRLTDTELAAIDMLDQLSNEAGLSLKMDFLPGDMQFLHNHQIMHSRTDFEDWPEPERKRHLLRLWLAPLAGRPLPDVFAARYGSTQAGDRGGIIVPGTRLTFSLEPN
ncbi:TauD/TfdA family dioxygenase [Candidimonas nitroreducens]|uniref:Taurine catabolism dioxygenase TauD n=1 Tax=Candidimonas nitroreducens TaxID=683354 RepID=A0A225MK02_9BURK|nr:TauD/TfdA family dioxygenase [Candidimonas nitroreducens]OWT61717.1 taurine catabolism dioxygenase TauD [Candidimonas nitroreducens]